jgi:hypothetical protein
MTRYKVVRGYTIRNGVIHREGSFFDADPAEVKTELRKGIILAAAPGEGEEPTRRKTKS